MSSLKTVSDQEWLTTYQAFDDELVVANVSDLDLTVVPLASLGLAAGPDDCFVLQIGRRQLDTECVDRWAVHVEPWQRGDAQIDSARFGEA